MKLHVVIVEDVSAPFAGRGDLLSSKLLDSTKAPFPGRNALAGLRIVDKDVVGPNGNVPFDVRRFVSVRPLPRIFVVTEDGEVVADEKLSDDPVTHVITLIKRIRK